MSRSGDAPRSQLDPSRAPRNAGLDLGKWLGCFAVVVIHQSAADYGGRTTLYEALCQSARWAVPFYFLCSGALLAAERSVPGAARRVARRIVPAFLFWRVVYNAVVQDPAILLERLHVLGYWRNFLINGGNGYHLWYLTSLAACIVTYAAVASLLPRRAIVAIVIAAFGLGLVLGAYYGVLIGSGSSFYNVREFPFMALGFFLLGTMLPMPRPGDRRTFRLGLLLLVLGGIGTVLESVALNRATAVPVNRLDLVVATVPFAVGAFLAFASLDLSGRIARIATAAGSVSLGVYAMHLMLLRSFEAIAPTTSPAVGAGLCVATVLAATALALALKPIPVVRRIVA